MGLPNVPDARAPLPLPPPTPYATARQPSAPPEASAATGELSAEAVHYAGAPPVRRQTLTTGWRWVLACGWGTVMAGIGVVANTGFILGDPPFWTGNGLAVLPFVAPVLVLIALVADWRYEIQLSFLAVGVTFVIGLIDLFHAPPMGYGELIFAFVALLITIAAMAGLVPHDEPDAGDGAVS